VNNGFMQALGLFALRAALGLHFKKIGEPSVIAALMPWPLLITGGVPELP